METCKGLRDHRGKGQPQRTDGSVPSRWWEENMQEMPPDERASNNEEIHHLREGITRSSHFCQMFKNNQKHYSLLSQLRSVKKSKMKLSSCFSWTPRNDSALFGGFLSSKRWPLTSTLISPCPRSLLFSEIPFVMPSQQLKRPGLRSSSKATRTFLRCVFSSMGRHSAHDCLSCIQR